MQRVVIVSVCILSVVRATPFDLDSVNRPTPFQYKGEFGIHAFSEGSKHGDDYEIGSFKSDKNSNFIDKSDRDTARQGLIDLFGDLPDCDLTNVLKPPKEGCQYSANGNIYLLHVLAAVDIEDVYKAFKEAGIEECEVGEDEFTNVSDDGCFWIDEDNESVHWIGFYKAEETDDITQVINNLEECNTTDVEVPEEGCILFDEDGITFVNILTEDNIDDVKRGFCKIGLIECTSLDKDHVLITKYPCYEFDGFFNAIYIRNYPLPRKPEGVQDEEDNNGEENYKVPDKKVSPSTSVQTATGNVNLLQLKGVFNQRSSVAKHFLPMKIKSIKQLQE